MLCHPRIFLFFLYCRIKNAIPCKKVGLAVIGLEVPHAHIHLVPINSVSDINFSLPKLKLEANKLKDIQEKIKAAYKA